MSVNCSIEGCPKPARKRGWCEEHYGQWRQHGDPLVRKRRRRGTGTITHGGYLAHGVNEVKEHIAIAERVLGKPLPPGAVVHHIDENKLNNATTNLVICPNNGYHALLHQRMNALAACGHADWRQCKRCHEYDDPATMGRDGRSVYHRACNVEHVRRMKAQRAA